MNPYIVVTLIVVATAAADYLLKVSSYRQNPFSSAHFWVGAVIYSFTAAGWMLAMRHLSLASIGVYYSMITILLLSALGIFVFKESISFREVIGIVLALASLSLMTKFS